MADRDDSPFSTSGAAELPPGVERPRRDKPPSAARIRWENTRTLPGVPVFSIASLGKGRLAWAAWATLEDAAAVKEPAAHGEGTDRERIEMRAYKAASLLNTFTIASNPRKGMPGLVSRWRRKEASRKRAAASTATSNTETRVTGLAYEHYCENDYSNTPEPPDILAYRGDANGFFAAFRAWSAAVPRTWKVRVHRIVKRTPQLVFVLREPGETAGGADLDGVLVSDCWSFDRSDLERGRAIRRNAPRGQVGWVWWSLSPEVPAAAVDYERAGWLPTGAGDEPVTAATGAPDCIAALGLVWPCTAADVRRAFKQQALTAHPDHGGTSSAFIALRKAYKQALELVAGAAGRGRAA